jgi:hypothetical protein
VILGVWLGDVEGFVMVVCGGWWHPIGVESMYTRLSLVVHREASRAGGRYSGRRGLGSSGGRTALGTTRTLRPTLSCRGGEGGKAIHTLCWLYCRLGPRGANCPHRWSWVLLFDWGVTLLSRGLRPGGLVLILPCVVGRDYHLPSPLHYHGPFLFGWKNSITTTTHQLVG